MAENIIEIKDVNKGYRLGDDMVPVLKDINFTVKRGEFVAILGPSGSGKTTLMNIIGCMDVLDSGKYYLNGRAIHDTRESDLTEVRNKEIGFIFQNYNLVPDLNVYENVILPVQLDGKKVDAAFTDSILEMLKLREKKEALPGMLSGGQQQRVAIARAIAAKPAIILADEPTGNLDTASSHDVLGLLKAVAKQFQQTVILITHDQDIAQMADRIIRIEDGKIVKGSVADDSKQ